jgi:hypothetical protein
MTTTPVPRLEGHVQVVVTYTTKVNEETAIGIVIPIALDFEAND